MSDKSSSSEIPDNSSDKKRALSTILDRSPLNRLSDEALEELDKLLEPGEWRESCARAIEKAGIKNPAAIPGVVDALRAGLIELERNRTPLAILALKRIFNNALDALGIGEGE